jgi:hypothetical protein
MKNWQWIFCIVGVSILIDSEAQPVTSEFNVGDVSGNEFCWKDTEPRGVGTFPQACADGFEMIGALCYPECGEGYKRFGFDCHQICPDNMRDDGLYCRSAEYGRGTGYPWVFGDPAFNLNNAIARCEADNPDGCELWGAIAYPKCKDGYAAFGCCLCRPEQPDCGALGFASQLDLSCAKTIVIGTPHVGVCADGEEENAGLCYSECSDPTFKGVGPVCWSETPPYSEWVDCGMGFAESDVTCGVVTGNQVWSVAEMVINLVSLGTATPGTKAVSAAISTSADAAKAAGKTVSTTALTVETISQVAGVASELKGSLETIIDISENDSGNDDEMEALAVLGSVTSDVSGLNLVGLAEIMVDQIEDSDGDNELTNEEVGTLVDTGLDLITLIDPTGISGVVDAYMYPVCSDMSAAYAEDEDYFTICVEADKCIRAVGSSSVEGKKTKLRGARETNNTLGNGAFKITPIEDGSEYVTICVAGEVEPGDGGADLCLHAYGGSISKKSIKLHNGEDYNSEKPNGAFKITPIEDGSEYSTICVAGKDSMGDGTDLCMHAIAGNNIKLYKTHDHNKTKPNGRFKIVDITD